MKSDRHRSYFFLLINVLCWGAAFVAVKPAFEVTTPFRFLFYRHVLAAVLTLPLWWYFRSWWPKLKKKLLLIIGLETLGATLALTLVYEGLKRTSVIEAGLLTTALPLFITVGGVILLKEKEEKHEWIGTFIALAATLYLTVLPSIGIGPLSGISFTGNILIIGANIANMFYFPLAKKYYAQLPKMLITMVSFFVSTISFFALSLFEFSLGRNLSFSNPAVDFNPQPFLPALLNQISTDLTALPVIIATIYMAIFGSIIGLTAYIKGQDGIESSEASLFYYLQPLVYLPLAFVLLGESLRFDQLLALGVILLGVVVAEKRKK